MAEEPKAYPRADFVRKVARAADTEKGRAVSTRGVNFASVAEQQPIGLSADVISVAEAIQKLFADAKDSASVTLKSKMRWGASTTQFSMLSFITTVARGLTR